MGWLPARPINCRCGPDHASRQHLLNCLRVAEKLNVDPTSIPNPLDFVLNLLPLKTPVRPSDSLISRWSSWWPVVCQVMLENDQICLPEGTFVGSAADTSGTLSQIIATATAVRLCFSLLTIQPINMIQLLCSIFLYSTS